MWILGGGDALVWVFHLSSPLSALSLEPGMFIRGWGGSWIPQYEIGRDANPDRLVIKNPSERRKRQSGEEGRGRASREDIVALLLILIRQHINFDPKHLFFFSHNKLRVKEEHLESLTGLYWPITSIIDHMDIKRKATGQRNRGYIGFMSSFMSIYVWLQPT